MSLPAREWNKLLKWLALHAEPLPGENCRVSRSVNGTSLVPTPAAFRWRHPWQVSPEWDAVEKRWVATVRAGFVNGIDPTIGGVPLCATPQPRIALPVQEFLLAPPRFFEALGARDPTEGFQLGGSTGVQIVDESWKDAFRPPPRRLARCDVSLSVARAGLDSNVTLEDGSATGQYIDWTPSLNSTLLSLRGARPVVQASAMFEPPRTPTLLERMMGTASDAQEDALLLATVFLLSPANFEGQPDGSWTPYVRHACFWNLAHAPRVAKIADSKPITLYTGIAGGMFDGIFNQLLAPGNEASDRIAAAFQSQSPEGRFWTI